MATRSGYMRRAAATFSGWKCRYFRGAMCWVEEKDRQRMRQSWRALRANTVHSSKTFRIILQEKVVVVVVLCARVCKWGGT